LNGTYLFSAFEAEKNAIVLNYSAVFKLEGVAYYIRQNAPISCTALTQTTGYSLVVKTCVDDNAIAFYDKTECVRDNTTGLIWQGQTARGTGLRANDALKTNYDSTTKLQKYIGLDETTGQYNPPPLFGFPTQADINDSTNSIGFKNAINTSKLCGSGAWRLPTYDEIQGLLTFAQYNVLDPFWAIDLVWFPNTTAGDYLTSTPVDVYYSPFNNPATSFSAIHFTAVYFDPIQSSVVMRSTPARVRLVR
jgi:Protein of unknown function (DUF1566)